MKHDILLVDDEKNILDAYRRNLRDHFEIAVADSGAAALEILRGEKSFPVIVTDYKMPGMNGVELLKAVRTTSPDTVQIMLTGQAEMQAVIDLINKGKIFRFLTKPCAPEDLISNINDAVRQYELVTAERELLGKTLGGSIRVLTDLLAMAKPQAFHRAQRIRSLTGKICAELKPKNQWQIEIAAMLSQIGCVTIPDEILKKAYAGRRLADYELVMFQNHPVIAADMIRNIPRLDKVAEIIKYQEKNFDGSGNPVDDVAGEAIPLGSRIIKVAVDYDNLVNAGIAQDTAMEELSKKTGIYDNVIFSSAVVLFHTISEKGKRFTARELDLDDLKEGMYLVDDVVSAQGVILGSKNQYISDTLIVTLKNYQKNKQVMGPLKVLVLYN